MSRSHVVISNADARRLAAPIVVNDAAATVEGLRVRANGCWRMGEWAQAARLMKDADALTRDMQAYPDAPLLEIAAGDVVTPVYAWVQASAVRLGGAELHVGARYTVASVEGGFAQAFVTLVEQPAEKFPAHLFARAG